MALMTAPVAGAYTATFAAVALGIMDDNGFELSFTPQGQDINDTDQFGMSLIEGIYRGANVRIRFRAKEWTTGVQNLIHTFGAKATATPAWKMGVIGRKYTDIAGVLILTATAGTPAAASPATFTASSALLSPNTNLSFLFTSKLREVAFEMILLPYTSTGDVVWATTT